MSLTKRQLKFVNACMENGSFEVIGDKVKIDGSISIKNFLFKKLPVCFSTVTGYFEVSSCHNLQTTAGFPTHARQLSILSCENIYRNMDHLPTVSHSVHIVGVEKFTDLCKIKHCDSLSGNFTVSNCGITSLKGVPKRIGSSLNVTANKKLTTLSCGYPIEIASDLNCSFSNLIDLANDGITIVNGSVICFGCGNLKSTAGLYDIELLNPSNSCTIKTDEAGALTRAEIELYFKMSRFK